MEKKLSKEEFVELYKKHQKLKRQKQIRLDNEYKNYAGSRRASYYKRLNQYYNDKSKSKKAILFG